MNIQKLSPEVVDQIAAGEVLERPANMLKEFIENSLDANANEIDIDVDSGGRHVVINDNGDGIRKAEMSLALDRHATSKISKSSDLWSLNSYGFRGEALASISSVSRLKLISRHKDEEEASSLESEFGKLGSLLDSHREQGTSILVDELFGNVPARLKFLKTDSAELSAIRKMLKAFALSFPKTSFRLRSGGKLLNYWPMSDSKLIRCQQVLEKKKMYFSSAEIGLMRCEIVFTAPNETQRNSQNMWFFVQDRWIQDRSLQAAVMAGFENTLMHGEYPICAVWIYCDPQDVDVNVHPTKSQVKFRDPRSAFKVVREAVIRGVSKAAWLDDLLPNAKPQTQNELVKNQDLGIQESFIPSGGHDFEAVNYAKKSIASDSLASIERPMSNAMEVLKTYASPFKKSAHNQNKQSEAGKLFGGLEDFKEEDSIKPDASAFIESSPFNNRHHWSRLQVLGQANLTYIVAQSRQSLLLIDQHAAHERVAFEKIVKAWEGGAIEVQSFLFPLTFTFESHLVDGLMTAKEDISKLGIQLEQSGPEEVSVSSAPLLLKEKAIFSALDLLAREIEENGAGTAMERKLKDIAASMACHSVVRAGQSLSIVEMEALLEQMDEFPLSSFCPHGRPVFVEYPFQKIDRDFGRIV